MGYDVTEVKRTGYDATWDPSTLNFNLGGIDDVRFECPLIMAPLKIGSAGGMKLDDRFVGLGDDARIITVVKQVTLARIRKIYPWDDGSGAVDGTPIPNASMRQYAKPLLLHPISNGAATTEDITVYFVVPIPTPPRRNGTDFDAWEVPWFIYPDLTKLAAGTNPYYEYKGV